MKKQDIVLYTSVLVLMGILIRMSFIAHDQQLKHHDQIQQLQAQLPPDPQTFTLDSYNYLSGRQVVAGSFLGGQDDVWALYFQNKKTMQCSVTYVTHVTILKDRNLRMSTVHIGKPAVKNILPNARLIDLVISFDGPHGYTVEPGSPPVAMSCGDVS